MSDANKKHGVLAYGRTTAGDNHTVQVDSSGVVQVSGTISVGGIGIPAWDYMTLTQASLTDTYVFKTGGSGGTTVATVTITYTDSSKNTISTVAKT